MHQNIGHKTLSKDKKKQPSRSTNKYWNKICELVKHLREVENASHPVRTHRY